MTLLGGYLGFLPPPTIAIRLHRKSISTIPMPSAVEGTERVREGERVGEKRGTGEEKSRIERE
jgi:hypothetical protein